MTQTVGSTTTATKLEAHDGAQYLIEAKDLWTSRLPRGDAELAPKVIEVDGGAEAWQFDNGRWFDPIGLEVAAGRGDSPLRARYRYDQLESSVLDSAARKAQMDTEGIDQASIFPTYALNVLNIEDPGLHVRCVHAYNDAVAEWCSAGTGRLRAHAMVPATGLDDAVTELDRVIDLGMSGVVFGGWPSTGRIPSADDDPFWRRCEDAGVAIHLVRGGPVNAERATRPATPASVARYMGGDGSIDGAGGPTIEALTTDLATTKNSNLSWLVLSGVLDRFPGLHVVLVQAGAGWLATCGELLDWNYRYAQFVPGAGFAALEDLPSEYIKRQVYATIETDQRTLAFLAQPDRQAHSLWASGYPTSTSCLPGCQPAMQTQTADLAPDVRQRFLQTNYQQLYRTRP